MSSWKEEVLPKYTIVDPPPMAYVKFSVASGGVSFLGVPNVNTPPPFYADWSICGVNKIPLLLLAKALYFFGC